MTKNEIENTRDSLIKEWFNKLENNELNDTVLLLFDANEPFIQNIENRFSHYANEPAILSYNLHSFDTANDSQKNIIMNISRNKLAKDPAYINTLYSILSKRVFLFIPENSNFYTNPEKYYENTHNIATRGIEKSYLYFIGEFDPYEFILKHSNHEIKEFMNFNQKHGLISLFGFDMNRYLYKQINVPENDLEKLYKDIDVLKSSNILTSRLGIVIYRMIGNIKETTTHIGRYFHKCTGSASKAIKLPFDINSNSNIYKAYDLNVNESEMNIRKEIAKELLALNIKKLDSSTIAKITKVPSKTIDKMLKPSY
ncbi:MAG: hypothetical protein WC274_04715 [Sulfurimonas sp.]|jgi:hypothetical protein